MSIKDKVFESFDAQTLNFDKEGQAKGEKVVRWSDVEEAIKKLKEKVIEKDKSVPSHLPKCIGLCCETYKATNNLIDEVFGKGANQK